MVRESKVLRCEICSEEFQVLRWLQGQWHGLCLRAAIRTVA